jgi:hypothetical protein
MGQAEAFVQCLSRAGSETERCVRPRGRPRVVSCEAEAKGARWSVAEAVL